MNSVIVNKACGVSPPISSAVSGNDGVVRLATSAASQRFSIPDSWKNRYVTLYAEGLDIQVLTGGPTLAVALNAVSTVVSENITVVDPTSGVTISAGTAQDFFFPRNDKITKFAMISSGTSGFLAGYPSDTIHPSKTA